MTTIRLTRMGAKKRPFYRIVVVDSRQKRDGEYIECVGVYQPVETPAKVEINVERLSYYVSCGAKLSATVKSLVREKGIKLGVAPTAEAGAKVEKVAKPAKPAKVAKAAKPAKGAKA